MRYSVIYLLNVLFTYIVQPFIPSTRIIVLYGFSHWKGYMRDWFPGAKLVFVPLKLSELDFRWRKSWFLKNSARVSVLAWQYKGPLEIRSFCTENDIEFQYVEDGFIRSLKLGALHTPPLSMAFDRQDMYFNARGPTDLEDILANYDFAADPDLITRATAAIDALQRLNISKYNMGKRLSVDAIYGPKTKTRIMVIGQVERDASIRFGCETLMRNNDLVRLARSENPDAQIIYKPHPEVLHGTADALSNPNEVRDICEVLEEDISLGDSLDTIDHVYTITSLAGFEALLRGKKVTTCGCPFYSGWGLTDDRQPNPRRRRKLTVEEVFAAAYILYPKYFDPESKRYIEIEDAIAILDAGLRRGG